MFTLHIFYKHTHYVILSSLTTSFPMILKKILHILIKRPSNILTLYIKNMLKLILLLLNYCIFKCIISLFYLLQKLYHHIFFISLQSNIFMKGLYISGVTDFNSSIQDISLTSSIIKIPLSLNKGKYSSINFFWLS